jgi:outer membrane protein W
VAVSTPKKVVAQNDDDFYKTALGVKFLHGISLTAKHFINEKGALEAVIQYRHYTDLGSEINFTGLYEYHGKITGASGLRWYVGGGAYAGYFSSSNDALDDLDDGSSNFTFGVAGTVGLEYKIKGVPLAISADWQPLYIINGNSSFVSDNGGIGIKYTF